jgi:YD repeat-containing protein
MLQLTFVGEQGTNNPHFNPGGGMITLIAVTAAGVPVMLIVDSYDPGGRKTSTSKNGVVTTYSYDATNRLLGQTVLGGCATFSYDAAIRLVTQLFGTTTLTAYNQAGGMSTETVAGAITSYGYDGESRLLKITYSSSQVLTNSYSGDGLRRTWQAFGGHINTQIWDGANYLGEIQSSWH